MRVVRSVCGTVLAFFALVCLDLMWKHVAHPETIPHPETMSLGTRLVVDAVFALVCAFSAYSMFTWDRARGAPDAPTSSGS
jgi:hypothetical protein